MKKMPTKALRKSFIALILICLTVLITTTLFLSKRSEKTITEVSKFYMSAMNSQLQQKFSLIIELTLEKIDGVINRTPPETASYGPEMLKDLQISAKVRNFVYLGFLKSDGSLETIYGTDTTITDSENIMAALEEHRRITETGLSADGERSVLLGRAAAYPTSDGTKSVALIAGISPEYLSSIIFAETDDSIIFSHIINESGDYVIRTSLPGSVSENYLDYIRTEMEGIAPEDAARYVNELQESIRNRKEFTDTFIVDGETRHVYCVPLQENSTWYLVMVMPSGFLNTSITQLDRDRTFVMISVIAVILFSLSLVFFQYYRLSQQQIRLLNEARKEANRANRSKSAFLSNMSHDIRTPMNAIVGMSEIAINNIDNKARVEDCLRKVKLSSRQLLGLINDVLDMSKIESGKMTLRIEEISLREVMDGIVNIIQPQVKDKKQKFNIFIRDILTEHVWCDSVRLNQILLNLLSNALKFTPAEGQIEVSLYQEDSPSGEEFVRTHFLVTDTGIGMSPEFLDRIFESFEREASDQVHHTMGSGLGMSITKHIVDMMGGTIEINSIQGQGSSFHITLDLKKAIAEEEMKLPEWNILVVDDNSILCESAAAMLEELGTHPEWTTDGMEAARMIEEHHDRKEDYQFALIDWKMPGMDGLQTIREVRRRVGNSIPIFLISAYDWSDLKDELDIAEVAGFIPKPLFKSTLYNCLSEYTEGYQFINGSAPTETVDFTGNHILLAEDNDLNYEIVQELFREVGLEIDRAENGKICVDKFKESAPGFYDVILMDIQMPVMDGYQATALIRAADRPDSDIPIIAMTANAFSEDAQHCLDCGMNYHMTKPLDFPECCKILKRYINSNESNNRS